MAFGIRSFRRPVGAVKGNEKRDIFTNSSETHMSLFPFLKDNRDRHCSYVLFLNLPLLLLFVLFLFLSSTAEGASSFTLANSFQSLHITSPVEDPMNILRHSSRNHFSLTNAKKKRKYKSSIISKHFEASVCSKNMSSVVSKHCTSVISIFFFRKFQNSFFVNHPQKKFYQVLKNAQPWIAFVHLRRPENPTRLAVTVRHVCFGEGEETKEHDVTPVTFGFLLTLCTFLAVRSITENHARSPAPAAMLLLLLRRVFCTSF